LLSGEKESNIRGRRGVAAPKIRLGAFIFKSGHFLIRDPSGARLGFHWKNSACVPGGNAALHKDGATVVAHENVRIRLAAGTINAVTGIA
jgi:hypothetical protein